MMALGDPYGGQGGPAAFSGARALMANQAPMPSLAAHQRNPAYAPWLAQQGQTLAGITDPNARAQWINNGQNYAAVAGLEGNGTLPVGAGWQADLQTHSGNSPTPVNGAQGPLTGYPSQVGTNAFPTGGSMATGGSLATFGNQAGNPAGTPAPTVGSVASGMYQAPNAPAPWTPTTASNMITDPGYQFRLDQGEKALQGSAAARGGLLSGDTLRGINDYAANSASQEFGAADQRRRNDYNTQYGNYQDQRNFGQSQFVDNRNFNYARDVGDRAFDYNAQQNDQNFNYGRIRDLLSAGMSGTQGAAGSNNWLGTNIAQIMQNNGQINGNASIANGNIGSSAISQAIQQALYQSLFPNGMGQPQPGG